MLRLSRVFLLGEFRLVLNAGTGEAMLSGNDVGRHKVGIRDGVLIIVESERGSGA